MSKPRFNIDKGAWPETPTTWTRYRDNDKCEDLPDWLRGEPKPLKPQGTCPRCGGDAYFSYVLVDAEPPPPAAVLECGTCGMWWVPKE